MGADEMTGSAMEIAVSRGRILLTIILDSLFLGVWLAILWLFDLVTKHIHNSGDLEWHTAKFILGTSTLICIALFVFWDLKSINLLLRQGFEEHSKSVEGVQASPSGRGANGGI